MFCKTIVHRQLLKALVPRPPRHPATRVPCEHVQPPHGQPCTLFQLDAAWEDKAKGLLEKDRTLDQLVASLLCPPPLEVPQEALCSIHSPSLKHWHLDKHEGHEVCLWCLTVSAGWFTFSRRTGQVSDGVPVSSAIHIFSLWQVCYCYAENLQLHCLHLDTAQCPWQTCKAAEHMRAGGSATTGFGGLAMPGHIRPAMPSQPLHPLPVHCAFPALYSVSSVVLSVSFLMCQCRSCLILNHM